MLNAVFNARKNADWIKQFQYTEGGVGVDITGGTLRFQVRERAQDKRAFISLSSDDDTIQITNAVLGKFTLVVRAVDMQAMEPRDGYVHDLLLTRDDGIVLTLWEGVFNLGNGVTR